MKASEFDKRFGPDRDFWSQEPGYPRQDWQHEVSRNETLLGYWDWVLAKQEQDNESRTGTE